MLNANENPNNQPVEEVHPDPVLVGPVLPENQSTSTKKSTREKQLSNIRYTQLTGSIVLGCISTLCFHYLGAKKEDFADADAKIQLGQKIVRDLACSATFSYYRVYARNEFLKHFGGLLAGTVLDSVLLLHNQKPELFAERLVANSWGTLLGLTNSVLFGKNALFPTEVVYSLANHVSHTLLHKTPSIMAVDQKVTVNATIGEPDAIALLNGNDISLKPKNTKITVVVPSANFDKLIALLEKIASLDEPPARAGSAMDW